MDMEVCGRVLYQVISWHADGKTEGKKTTKSNIQDCQCLDLKAVPSEDICKVTTTPACFTCIYVQQMLE